MGAERLQRMCPQCQEEHTSREHEPDELSPPEEKTPQETARTPTDDTGPEEDPVVEYANGSTVCDRETGNMVTTIDNTKCTRGCTEEHEADHRAYRGPCCRTYAEARRAAIDAGDLDLRNQLSRRYNAWVRSTSGYSECRASRVSVACGERMEQARSCDSPSDENRECCGDVARYLTRLRRHRDENCPGADQDCPDFG